MKNYVIILFSLVSPFAVAQSVPSVNVEGEGVVYATPDIINISISIENEGQNVKLLKQKNGEKVAKVIEVLMKELPIENFQTSHVSLRNGYDYNTKTHKYYISQSINIKLEDVSKYESIMETIFEAGVNQINSVTFDVKNREQLMREARLLAINNARQKALFYAVSLEQNIGKALKISEKENDNEVSQYFAESMVAEKSAGVGQTTLALGTIKIEAKIDVSFELTKE